LAIFVGATDIPRDIDSGIILIYLTKPLRKSYYILGKYFGMVMICSIFFFVGEISIQIGHFINTSELYSFESFFRQLCLVSSFFPLVAMTCSISCIFPDFSAMIISVIYLIFAISLSSIPLLLEMLPQSLGIDSYVMFIYYFFPNFIFYFQSFEATSFVSVALLFYSFSISCIFLTMATWHFRNRDIS
ncbi:MAG: hypothetical protein U9O87_02970, partial [Verrucomicrobiota bacterium]|nr:hypothetical protein [Verrucomicrobiota bacterium]